MPTPWPQHADRSPRAGKAVDAAAPLLAELHRALDGQRPPCADHPALWTSDDRDDVALAVAGCGPCPAVTECRSYARAVRPVVGTWGAGRAVYVHHARKVTENTDVPPRTVSPTESNRRADHGPHLLDGSVPRLPTATAPMHRDGPDIDSTEATA